MELWSGSSCPQLIFVLNNVHRFDFSVLGSCTEVYFTYMFQKYLKDMQAYFGAEPQSVNFVGASGQIRTEINSWVESQTGGKLSSRA